MVVINQCRNNYFGYQIKNTWIICTDLKGFITALSACSWWSIRHFNVINLFPPSSIRIKKIKSKKIIVIWQFHDKFRCRVSSMKDVKWNYISTKWSRDPVWELTITKCTMDTWTKQRRPGKGIFFARSKTVVSNWSKSTQMGQSRLKLSQSRGLTWIDI